LGSTDPNPADATGPEDEDHTIVVDRAATRDTRGKVPRAKETDRDEDDHTIAVDRDARATASPRKPSTTRMRGLVPPPVSSELAPRAAKGIGADATERYRPRTVSPPPSPAPMIAGGPASTREASAAMPSVARHGRLIARAAVAAFSVSCVASVVGLTLIALALLARR